MQILAFVLISYLCCVKSEYFEECFGLPDDTFVPVNNDCHSYIHCSDNEDETYKDECPGGTYFEANSLECVTDEHNICPRNDVGITDTFGEEEVDTEAPTTKPEELGVTTTLTTSTSFSSGYTDHFVNFTTPRPTCYRHVDGFYPHHDRCEYYYKCVAGFLTILRCNFFYAWDYRKEMCVPQKEAECYLNSKLRKLHK